MRRGTVAVAFAVLLVAAASAAASHLAIDTEGHTTLEQVIACSNADPGNTCDDGEYDTLAVKEASGNYVLRDRATVPGAPRAQEGREERRTSRSYFAQLTDFQLADEESPARVEFLDQAATSAWRPWEALTPFMVDHSIRQVNRFFDASPVPQADGSGNVMDFALMTGDQADNQQRNETLWVRDLLEGNGPLRFNSGFTQQARYTDPQVLARVGCAGLVAQEGGPAGAAAEGARYTGVQDYGDYPPPQPAPPQGNYFYDPSEPAGSWLASGWPEYDGLPDRAQTAQIAPQGLDVPFYVTNGNHDVLVQGNEDANKPFEDVAMSCLKTLAVTADTGGGLGALLNPSNANLAMFVPPDDLRQFVSKLQIKDIYAANDPEAHGFEFADETELEASNESASYYSWDPPQTPGLRFVSIDTNSEGGVVGESSINPVAPGSSSGHLDDPQFKWLQETLDAARDEGRIVVLFGHHPVRSMESVIPDEAATPCTTNDAHGHDVNPGCDLDPRGSQPLHLGSPEDAERLQGDDHTKTFVELMAEYPNAVAYVSGHTHENKVIPFQKEGTGVWWELGTSAVIDHPQQHRLIDVMDNDDTTLSIFGTILDHASAGTPPPSGNASGFTGSELASIGRAFAYNDPQSGFVATDDQASGAPEDQNVELLAINPQNPKTGGPERCKGKIATIVGTDERETITGTPGKDVIAARGGNDKVNGRRGKDVICGGKGNDRLKGGRGMDRVQGGGGGDRLRGGKGRDRLSGGKGRDKLAGGKGRDRLKGGKGRDKLSGGKGRDSLNGGKGRDRCRPGPGRDRKVKSCERPRRGPRR